MPDGGERVRPQDSDTRNYYDDANSPDTAPIYGSITRAETLKDRTQAGGTVWRTTSGNSFDAFGQVLTTTDIKGNVVSTTYTPATRL